MTCFESWKASQGEAAELFGVPDKFCLLEDGHAGEHEWTEQADVFVTFIGESQ